MKEYYDKVDEIFNICEKIERKASVEEKKYLSTIQEQALVLFVSLNEYRESESKNELLKKVLFNQIDEYYSLVKGVLSDA